MRFYADISIGNRVLRLQKDRFGEERTFIFAAGVGEL
jgi:hypothetical protein